MTGAYNIKLVGGGVIVGGIEASSAEDAMRKYLRWFGNDPDAPTKVAGKPEAIVTAGPYRGHRIEAVRP